MRNSSISHRRRATCVRRVAHQELVRLKRMFEFTDNDDDILIAPKRMKRTPDNHTKPKYDLDLSSKDNNSNKSIPHHAIN
ncbi:hypothetical protein CEXT_677121 [Caerostris extrusa]|uniref:Uncharacterized protein n=1 Tax=Caerostris extrusa TaxID=172846 RepID=A0AAV4NL25_CAEEX|nr:hypothetical protein CEXT_677121 [Caerostris extrusa]